MEYVSPLPSDDKRLQRRYLQLVQEHLSPVQAIATGLRALPGTAQAFASTQAAWRFYANPRVTLPQLAQPLIEAARGAVEQDHRPSALVVPDWSQLLFKAHASKRDRAALSSATDLGSERFTALVLSDRDGAPLAPVCQQVRAAGGVSRSRVARVPPVPSQRDALAPTLRFVPRQKLGRRMVPLIEREADSVAHDRQWARHQRLFGSSWCGPTRRASCGTRGRSGPCPRWWRPCTEAEGSAPAARSWITAGRPSSSSPRRRSCWSGRRRRTVAAPGAARGGWCVAWRCRGAGSSARCAPPPAPSWRRDCC